MDELWTRIHMRAYTHEKMRAGVTASPKKTLITSNIRFCIFKNNFKTLNFKVLYAEISNIKFQYIKPFI